MLDRFIHRLLHFVIYALLFLTRQAAFKLQRVRNTLAWLSYQVQSGMQADEVILSRHCVSGQLLGDKKLSHVAVIVNEVHRDLNLPTQAQVAQLVEVVAWLMLSLEGTQQKTQITVFDREGRFLALADLVQALLRIRLGTQQPGMSSDDVSAGDLPTR